MQNMGLEHPRVFSLKELKDITDNFSEEREIGRGGSGVVYKGVLDNGEEIAVKKLHNHYDSSGNKLGNGEAQFLNELMNLIGVQHQNIIRLVGYCYETRNIVMECDGKRVLASEEERVLCLEYMEGGSLKDHLSDESCGLEWHTRFNIIIGVCEGLKYLHTGSENPIYHLDLKPENIWLDRNMIPKIGDFGISRLPSRSMQTYTTENAVSGTIGYMAPEYIGRNQISQKCDVYSLGFIMIRVIAGEKGPENYDPHRPPEEFIESVHKNWGRRWKATMSSHSLHQVKTCTEIALRCVEFNREKRPTITDIVNELNKIKAPESSAICGKNTEEEEHTTLEKQPAIQEQKENNAEQLEGKMKEKVDGRSAISPLHYRWSGSHEQDIQGHVLHLQSGVQHLKDTLPAMYNLIDEAEWRNHKTRRSDDMAAAEEVSDTEVEEFYAVLRRMRDASRRFGSGARAGPAWHPSFSWEDFTPPAAPVVAPSQQRPPVDERVAENATPRRPAGVSLDLNAEPEPEAPATPRPERVQA